MTNTRHYHLLLLNMEITMPFSSSYSLELLVQDMQEAILALLDPYSRQALAMTCPAFMIKWGRRRPHPFNDSFRMAWQADDMYCQTCWRTRFFDLVEFFTGLCHRGDEVLFFEYLHMHRDFTRLGTKEWLWEALYRGNNYSLLMHVRDQGHVEVPVSLHTKLTWILEDYTGGVIQPDLDVLFETFMNSPVHPVPSFGADHSLHLLRSRDQRVLVPPHNGGDGAQDLLPHVPSRWIPTKGGGMRVVQMPPLVAQGPRSKPTVLLDSCCQHDRLDVLVACFKHHPCLSDVFHLANDAHLVDTLHRYICTSLLTDGREVIDERFLRQLSYLTLAPYLMPLPPQPSARFRHVVEVALLSYVPPYHVTLSPASRAAFEALLQEYFPGLLL